MLFERTEQGDVLCCAIGNISSIVTRFPLPLVGKAFRDSETVGFSGITSNILCPRIVAYLKVSRRTRRAEFANQKLFKRILVINVNVGVQNVILN